LTCPRYSRRHSVVGEMNEKVSKVLNIVIILLLLVVSRFCWNSSRRTTENDITLRRTQLELSNTRKELQRANDELAKYRSRLGEVADRLRECNEVLSANNNGFAEYIQDLKVIADKVSDMEDVLSSLGYNSSYFGASSCVLHKQGEQIIWLQKRNSEE